MNVIYDVDNTARSIANRDKIMIPARSEYNFAVNELSKSSFNQAAILTSRYALASARVRQKDQNLRPLFPGR